MIYIPHDYQAFSTNFILSHPVAAVLLQMGLGKSVITLTAIRTLLDRGEIARALVIAPLRVARDTWPEEIRKWDHLKGLTFSVAVGSDAERRAALLQDVNIHIINRENVAWLMDSGLPLKYDMVVIDELSSFKSWQSKRFRALLKLRPFVSRIVGLTGTPTGNGLMDLFAEYRILDLGERLGRFIGQYRTRYFIPDKRSAMQIFTWKPRPGAEEEIYRRISDITVSMKSVDFLKMPECLMNTVKVRMDEKERKQYEKLKEELFLVVQNKQSASAGRKSAPSNVIPSEVEGSPHLQSSQPLIIDAKNAAALCGKLCQLANGACYTEMGEPPATASGGNFAGGEVNRSKRSPQCGAAPTEVAGRVARIHDRKLDALEDLIEASAGHPLLIAYWYQHDLSRICERFPDVRPLRSSQDIADWNAGRIALAAIHPASAGHGLNLQSGGNTLVWFGLTWSLELYQQANARLWRQGQTADTVVIHHIVTEGTIDEQILEALGRKDRTQESLIDAVKAQLPKGGDAV